ncbi:ABC transporter substrate-binding protein [Aeromicrobium sp. NPDC092404]|uniref:ABC transporter substrate-binding protein n=1 Tax=Aeromicrobium sp. NPDC092404 TaxID=3154976 RepID=UPI00342DB987
MKKLGAALAAASMIALAACGSSASDDAGSGPWKFKDDLGTAISLDQAPDRLIVQSSVAAALTDLGLGDKIVGTFGPLKNAEGKPDSQVAGLDITKATDVTGGGEYGTLDLEKAASLKPDLVVTSAYLESDLWYVNDATAKKLKQLAPIMVVSFDGKTLPEMLDSTERAATALGADVDSDAVQNAHDEFAAAADRVEQAGSDLGSKKIVVGSPAKDVFYVSNPQVSPDLKYWRDQLGLPITVPSKPDEGGYFQTLSWEKADLHPADVFLYDDRVGKAGLAILDDQPVFQTLAAAKDKAYIPWTSVAPPSYQAYADIMNRLATELEKYAG